MDAVCGRCGRPHQAGERFCSRCGLDLAPPVPPWLAQTALREPPPNPPPVVPPPQGRGRRVLLVAGIVLALLVTAGAVAGLTTLPGRRSVPTPAPTPPAPTPVVTAPATPTSPTWTPTPTPTATTLASPTPSVDPVQRLQELRAAGVARLRTDGHWVVQLASKYDGVVDTTQTAGDGSHVFRAADILAEHEALRARFGGDVILIGGGDMGKRWTGPGPVWTTVYDPGTFADEAAAQQWCRDTFPGRADKALENVCLPRTARPPFD